MSTYCNPLSLPDYPIGIACQNVEASDRSTSRWLGGNDFRELADPNVLYHEGRWYMYPSGGMAYVSEDFVTWKHCPVDPPDVGYAPTVAYFGGKFYLTACRAPLYVAESPLGPFKELGYFEHADGTPVADFMDPMLFADDDGRFYVYWGLGRDGIHGAELSPERPWQLLGKDKILMQYNPAHEWERFGPNNEDITRSYCEGVWMLKVGARYYLTYAASGTEWCGYSMGAYYSDSPLGDFTYQKNNPFLTRRTGLVRAPGHGCVVPGPRGTLWAFYTCLSGYEFIYERRVGMDPVGVNADGELYSPGVSDVPQLCPGERADPASGNGVGWKCLSYMKACRASSQAAGRDPMYATDASTITWWQPAATDPAPVLSMSIRMRLRARAIRIVWKDVGLSLSGGVKAGAFRYVVEVADAPQMDNYFLTADDPRWTLALDASDNDTDLLVDYRAMSTPIVFTHARLRILGAPEGITPGVVDFSIFGD